MKIRFSFFALMVSLLLQAAMPLASAKPSNEVVNIGMTQEFENMNPIIKTMMATTWIYSMVGRTLVTIDENGKWIPQLVKEIPSMENKKAQLIEEGGKKKIRAEWEIIDNAKWGDGTPVTAYDIEFSRMIALSGKVTIGEVEVYSQVERIEIDKANPKKFVFIYDKVRYDFNQLGTFHIVPKHLEEPVFKKYGDKKEGYEKNSLYTTAPATPGLYTGPYVIKEIKLGSHIILERNPNFYGKQANIKKLVLKLIPNTGTLEANLRSGNIDMISLLGFTLDQALAFEKKVKAENLPYDVVYRQGLVYEHIDLNLDNPILKDQKVRKALVYAIDRDKLTKALFEGKQSPAVHNIAPIDPWFTDAKGDIVHYETSKRTAKKLLEEAGWVIGKDGFRYKNGQKLSFQFMTTSGNKVRELVQQYLQSEWKDVGIEITIKNEPPRVFFGETTHKRKFPAMAMYAWISSPESNPKSTFHSKNIPSDKNGWSGQNYAGWVNKTVDQLLEQVEVEMDSKKRIEIAKKFLYHYTDDVPVIPLYYRSDIVVNPKNLTGFKLTGHQFPETNHIERWSFQ
jgi:peptide/nickel transport system substrate-binding protein